MGINSGETRDAASIATSSEVVDRQPPAELRQAVMVGALTVWVFGSLLGQPGMPKRSNESA
jgi:hypothetical protein